jgi:hypothetical protein
MPPSPPTRWYLVYRDVQAAGARATGAARQVLDGDGSVVREEGIGRDGDWHPTEAFRLQWLGKQDDDLVEVPQEQAERWVEDFRERLRLRAHPDAASSD